MTKEYDLTVKDAAKKVGVSPATIRYWMDYKDLEYALVDKGWGRPQNMVNASDLEQFVIDRGGK
jgi:predicted ArsR family transcriptional regulator